eukprot:gene6883-8217_t
MKFDATTTEDEWRQKLTPLQHLAATKAATKAINLVNSNETINDEVDGNNVNNFVELTRSLKSMTLLETLTQGKSEKSKDAMSHFTNQELSLRAAAGGHLSTNPSKVHNPEKVGEVESVLADFPNQDELLAALFQTYGAAPGMISQEQLLGFYQHFNHARANPKAVGEILQAFPMQRELVDALYQQYGAAPGGPHFAPLEVTREQLTAFYQEHNPAKVADVDEVLESFPDRMELLQSLKQAYNALPIEIPGADSPTVMQAPNAELLELVCFCIA